MGFARSSTRLRWAGPAAVALLLGSSLTGSRLHAMGVARISGNVAPWLAHARAVGTAAQSTRVDVSVYLSLRNQQGLQNLIQAQYRPDNPLYHRFLTAGQFRADFAPSAASVAAVDSFLTSHGLVVRDTPANRTYVEAQGTVGQIENTFGVTERLYRFHGLTLRANAQAPSVPASLASTVRFVDGLDQTGSLIQPQLRDAPDAPPGVGYATPGPCSTFWADHTATVTPQPSPYPATLPWVPCGYTPAQIRAAYGASASGLTGRGVRIGIVDAFASPTIVQDVNRFSATYGLPLLSSSNFQQFITPGAYNFPENRFDPASWYGEESLDVEWAHALAPGASIVFAGGQNSGPPLDHALIDMIDHHRADIISNSWGICGEYQQYGHYQADEAAFMQAAATGISVLVSSGDDGDCTDVGVPAGASYPASSPYVTAVGGTSLAVLNASGAKHEWGWGTYLSTLKGSSTSMGGTSVSGTAWSPWPPTFYYGSGGGVSFHFAQPSYQAGVVPTSIATQTVSATGQPITFSTPHRVVPDVSMDADPNTGVLYGQTYNISGNALIDAGCTTLSATTEYCLRRIGGTSLSSPMFAGVLALVDQARLNAGKGVIGFANPALYAAPRSTTPGGAALIDVLPPASPTALLRNTGSTGQTTTLRTINSTVTSSGTVIEGADSSLRTTAGYDDVTGLGTPYVPSLAASLAARP